jgi:hypothetical protein
MRDAGRKRETDAFCSVAEVMVCYLPKAVARDVELPDVSTTVDRMVAKLVESVAQRPANRRQRRVGPQDQGANR